MLVAEYGRTVCLGAVIVLLEQEYSSTTEQIGTVAAFTARISMTSDQEAVRRVLEALEAGATYLDLSRLGLIQLPEELSQLTRLQELDLSFNHLASLPKWLGQLTQLQTLKLYKTELALLPEWLGQLTQLQTLNLSWTQLTSLPEWLGQLTQLKILALSGFRWKPLPEWLGQLKQLQTLDLEHNDLTSLPEWLGQLTQLQTLNLAHNKLTSLPEWLGYLTQLLMLSLYNNQLPTLTASLGRLKHLWFLDLSRNQLTDLPMALEALAELEVLFLGDPSSGGNPLGRLPACIPRLIRLQELGLRDCRLRDLPPSLADLEHLRSLDLGDNPLNPELAAVYEEGLEAVRRYLRQRAVGEVVLNEAKLILVGEGEVGKSCLLGALRGDPWVEGRPTTHGIEIKTVRVTDLETRWEMTLNGWDFGGQRVYRPTHQLFFSSPAVYLVVWKPREGSQQGLVKEWIKLVKLRVPEAKIIVVATHGGPGERQPDIDRQEIWEFFGHNTVLSFFHVESKPSKDGYGLGIQQLRAAIARVAANLPEMEQKASAAWQSVREALQKTDAAYLPLLKVLEICRQHKLAEEDAELFINVSHRLGRLIHYEYDPALRDLVVLKPDWLATAISLALDDKEIRDAHGLVNFTRLGELWCDPNREESLRYPPSLHPVFLRLMERFDLSYRVSGLASENTNLIAQLVPNTRPERSSYWTEEPAEGEEQQVQICRIVEANNGLPAPAEGLFYQLIVRLHKYSLGKRDFKKSEHWQRGLVLDDDYNGRALLEHVGYDVRITVRAAYPERFLSVLTGEVKWLVESFWKGLRCDVMVPCIAPCGRNAPGTGLFKVQDLIEGRMEKRHEYPCPVCNRWQGIDALLRNAPAASRKTLEEQIVALQAVVVEGFDRQERRSDHNNQVFLSRMDEVYFGLLQTLTDEAKDGPRLFSFEPMEPGFLDRPSWVSAKFRLTLWCEHSRLPLPSLNRKDDRSGVYELNFPRQWLMAAAPFLKVLSGALGLVLPVAVSGTKLVLDAGTVKDVERQLDFGQKSMDSLLKGGEKAGGWLAWDEGRDLKGGMGMVEANGPVLRQLHAWLREKDPGFGGLVRVQNRRREFLWVHPQFAGEY